MALMSLLYRAVDQGLLVHPMAGWKEEPLRVRGHKKWHIGVQDFKV